MHPVVVLTCAEKRLLRLRIRGELRGVHNHGSPHRGDGAPPQREETLLARYSDESVEDVLVVTTLIGRKVSVRRHSDQRDLKKDSSVQETEVTAKKSGTAWIVSRKG